MEKLILSLIFLITVAGIYSGLSVAPAVALTGSSIIWYIKQHLEFNIRKFKLELLFIFWILINFLWAIEPSYSLIHAINFTTELLLGLFLFTNIAKLNIKIQKIEKILLFSFIFALCIFWSEYLSDGYFSVLFHQLLQKQGNYHFLLSNLDRGMAFLTLLSWLIIGFLLRKDNLFTAALVYFSLLISLFFSDNSAALVGSIIASFVFLLTRYTIFVKPQIMCFCLLFGSIAMIIFAFYLTPSKIFTFSENLPLSSAHRLFIWDFVAEKSKTQPLTGIGFNASKKVAVSDNEHIMFRKDNLHPLPLHPHNNVLQVYFELGIIGLIIYLVICCKYILMIGRDIVDKNRNWLSAQYSCFTAYFIIAMISYNLWQTWWVLTTIWISSLFRLIDFSIRDQSQKML